MNQQSIRRATWALALLGMLALIAMPITSAWANRPVIEPAPGLGPHEPGGGGGGGGGNGGDGDPDEIGIYIAPPSNTGQLGTDRPAPTPPAVGKSGRAQGLGPSSLALVSWWLEIAASSLR